MAFYKSFHLSLSALLIFTVLPLTTNVGAEICGLQNVVYDTIFKDGLDPPTVPVAGPALATVSAPALGVAPTIAITYPPTGATVDKDRFAVIGTFTGPAAIGVAVLGTPAYVVGNQFFVPGFSLASGSITLTATATTLDGLSASADTTITRSGIQPPLTVTADSDLGPRPFAIRFYLRLNAPTTISSLSVDFGDGSTPFSGAGGSTPGHTYTTAGIYMVLAQAMGANGVNYQASTQVAIGSIPEQRATICTVYAHLRARLLAGDREGALKAFSNTARMRYKPYFMAPGSDPTALAGYLGTIASGLIAPESAELTVVKAENGRWQGNALLVSRGADGVWRIDGL